MAKKKTVVSELIEETEELFTHRPIKPVVKFTILREDLTYDPIPTYAHDTDSGADLKSADVVAIPPGERRLVDTGISIELPPNYEAQVRPRSGLAANRGIQCHFGTIDPGYRGPIKVVLYNHGNQYFQIHPGDRIAQLVIVPVVQAEFVKAKKLDATDRGVNGFGSTNV